MGRIKTSFNLVKLAFKVINKEKELLVYSLLSSVCVIILILSYFAFIIGLSFMGAFDGQMNQAASSALDYVLMFLFYFGLTFIGLFFNTAIITSVNRTIRGENNTFFDGIGSAFKNIHKVFIWAIISSTISTILKIIQDRVPFVAKIVIAIVGAVWNIATFFAFPLMILGDRGAFSAIKESPQMFKKGWGETVATNVGVGLFFVVLIFSLGFLSILMFVGALVMGSVILSSVTIIVFVLGLAIFLLLSATTDAVLKTLLYVYIQEESLPEYVDVDLLGEMFKEDIKKK